MVDGRSEKRRLVHRGTPPQVIKPTVWLLALCTKKSGMPTWCREIPGQPSLIYIDRHLVHEGTSPQAFAGLKAAGRKVRRPDLTFAVMDHSVPTKNRLCRCSMRIARGAIRGPGAQLRRVRRACCSTCTATIRASCMSSGRNSASRSRARPIVCGDSHTSTHGAFGALAFGIGTSEIEHVLATQCLSQFKSKTMLVRVDGKRPRGRDGEGYDSRHDRQDRHRAAETDTSSNTPAKPSAAFRWKAA